jgi:hypothetical protein
MHPPTNLLAAEGPVLSRIRAQFAEMRRRRNFSLAKVGSRVRIPSPTPVSKFFEAAEFRGLYVCLIGGWNSRSLRWSA